MRRPAAVPPSFHAASIHPALAVSPFAPPLPALPPASVCPFPFVPATAASCHKISDTHALALLLEEGRLCMQGGQYEQALSLYGWLEQGRVPAASLPFLASVCRRECQQEMLAIGGLSTYIKPQEERDNPTAQSNSPAKFHRSLSLAALPSIAPHDPEQLVATLACEFERGLAWEALGEREQAARSAANFRRMVDAAASATSSSPSPLVPPSSSSSSDPLYARFLEVAKWMLNQGVEGRARSAIDRALKTMQQAEPNMIHIIPASNSSPSSTTLGDASASFPCVLDPSWLLLSLAIDWSMALYTRVQQVASFMRTPQASARMEEALTRLGVSQEHAAKQVQEARIKASLFLVAASPTPLPLSPSAVPTSLSTPISSSPPASPALSPLSPLHSSSRALDGTPRILEELLSPSSNSSLEVLHAAWGFTVNLLLARGQLKQAVAGLQQLVLVEERLEEQAQSRASIGESPPPRFPFFGPLSYAPFSYASASSASSTPSLGSSPSSSSLLPLVSHLNIYDLQRFMDSAPSSSALIQLRSAGGFDLSHASARHLLVLADFYSDLLLKYGTHDPRLLFNRSHVWAALGLRRMQMHDLQILLATTPTFVQQYVTQPAQLDWPPLPSASPSSLCAPLGRAMQLVSLRHLHLVASSVDTTLLDKNVRCSLVNLAALQMKYYQSWMEVQPVPAPSATSSPDASPIPASEPTSSSPAPPFHLLPCEDPLLYRAIIADLIRQQHCPIPSASNDDTSGQTHLLMIKRAQEEFERILNLIPEPKWETQRGHSPSPAVTAAVSVPPSSLFARFLCLEGLSLLHTHRLLFASARETALEGLHILWSRVDALRKEREERQRKQKEKMERERKNMSSGGSLLGGEGDDKQPDEKQPDDEPSAAPPLSSDTDSSSPLASSSDLPSITVAPERVALTGEQILSSHASVYLKALQLSAPLVTLMEEDPDVFGPDEEEDEEESQPPSPGRSLPSARMNPSLRSLLQPTQNMQEVRHHHPASDASVPAWLSPARLHASFLRRHAATLTSLIGLSYSLEGATDAALLCFYRALSLDPTDHLGHVGLLHHHLRFSPLHLSLKHVLQLLQHVPLFVPNMELINLSPMRYPLGADRAFSGAWITPDQRQRMTDEKYAALLEVEVLPFPLAIGAATAHCLTTRILERPHVHSSTSEVTTYLQSISSYTTASHVRHQLQLQQQRQHEVVERWKQAHSILSPTTSSTSAAAGSNSTAPHMVPRNHIVMRGLEEDTVAAVGRVYTLTCAERQASLLGPTVPMVLSLCNLPPSHPLHPQHQKSKFKFDADFHAALSADMLAGVDDRSSLGSTSSLRPQKPPGTASKSVRGGKKAQHAASGSIADLKSLGGFNLAEGTSSSPRVLPPFFHVEHRVYQPPTASACAAWGAAHWYKEGMKLWSLHDRTGALWCLTKCLQFDPDFSASLNYVLAMVETNGGEEEMQEDPSWTDGSVDGLPVRPVTATSSKHTQGHLIALFGRDKVLPVVWDIFMRAKAWEEHYGMGDMAYSDLSYALHFLPLADALWRRALLARFRSNSSLSLVDLSGAIQQSLLEQSVLERIPAPPPNASTRKPVLQEIKPFMSEKQKKEAMAANAAAMALAQQQQQSSPQACLKLLRRKLESYHLLRTLTLFQQGNHATALLDAQACLSINQKNVVALRLQALSLTHLHRFEEAAQQLERYVSLAPKDFGSRLRLANLYSHTGAHDAALLHFEKLMSAAPTNVAVLYSLSISFIRQHMWHEAKEALQQCIDLQPDMWVAHMRMGEVLERMEQLDQAIHSLQVALDGATRTEKINEKETASSQSSFSWPSSPSSPSPSPSLLDEGEGYVDFHSFHLDFLHKTLGRIYLHQAQRRYTEYLMSLEVERREKEKKRREDKMKLGMEGEREEQEEEGEEEKDASDETKSQSDVEITPAPERDIWAVDDTPEPDHKDASVEQSSGSRTPDENKADEAAVFAGAFATVSAAAAHRRAVEYVNKCLHMAYHSLVQAVTATPGTEDAEAHYLLALTILFLVGNRHEDPARGDVEGPGDQPGQVWSLLARVVQLDPAHIEARFLRGFLLQRQDRLDEAARELDQCLQLDPEHMLALQARAYIFFVRGEKPRALDYYGRMQGRPGPLRGVACANRGLVLLTQRPPQPHTALMELDHAISAAPMHALAYLYRAEAHKALGAMNEAIEDYRQAVPLLQAKIEEAEREQRFYEDRLKREERWQRHAIAALTPVTGKRVSTRFTFEEAIKGQTDAPPRRSSNLELPAAAAVAGSASEGPPRPSPVDVTAPPAKLDEEGNPVPTAPISIFRQQGQFHKSATHRWSVLRKLARRGQLVSAMEEQAALQAAADAAAAAAAASKPPTPPPAAAVPTVSSFSNAPLVPDSDALLLSMPAIHGVEHFKLLGSHQAVDGSTWQSEVGLSRRDLDSIHNSLGILLHQQAALNKKALAISTSGAASSRRAGGKGVEKSKHGKIKKSPKNAPGSSPTSPRHAAGHLAISTDPSSLSSTGDADSEALQYFTHHSAHFEAHYNRALIVLEHGGGHLSSLLDAQRELRLVVSKAPHFAHGHNNLGVVLEKLGQLDAAATHYTEALRLTKHQHLVAAFNLANIKLRTKHYQEASSLYTSFINKCAQIKRKQKKQNANSQTKRANEGGMGAANPASSSSVSSALLGPGVDATPGTGASSLARKHVDMMNPFEVGMVEHLRKEEEKEKGKLRGHQSRTQATTSNAKSTAAPSRPVLSPPPAPSSSSPSDPSLPHLVPLALNNRAICFQHLGQNSLALLGYTQALAMDPSRAFIKFNRAHLHMIMGNCFEALKDMEEFAREKARKEIREGKSKGQEGEPEGNNKAGEANKSDGGHETKEPGHTQLQKTSSASPNAPSSDAPSGTSSAYISSFIDYCQRFQWGLSVACDDMVSGLRVLPVVSHFNLSIPHNPITLFNPLMLSEDTSADGRRLRGLMERLRLIEPHRSAEPLRTEYEAANRSSMSGPPGVSSALSNPQPASHSQGADSKSKVVLVPSTSDSSLIATLKAALRHQVHQQHAECMDALLKAIYLLPPVLPSSLAATLSSSVPAHPRTHTTHRSFGGAGALPSAVENVLPSSLPTRHVSFATASIAVQLQAHDLYGELHEVLTLWRARLQVYLGHIDAAVSDLRFYVDNMLCQKGDGEGEGDLNDHKTRPKKRRVPRHGSDEDEDDSAGEGEDEELSSIALALGLPDANSLLTTNNASMSRAASRRASMKNSGEIPNHAMEPNTEGSRSATRSVAHTRSSSLASLTPAPFMGMGELSAAEEMDLHLHHTFYARRASTRHSRLLTYLGSLLHVLHRDEQAFAAYSRAIELDPTNLYPLLNRSLMARMQGKFSNAIDDLMEMANLLKLKDERQREIKEEEQKEKEERKKEEQADKSDSVVAANVDPFSTPPLATPLSLLTLDVDTGLLRPPSLRFSPSQTRVLEILRSYHSLLHGQLQEKWEEVTGLQGQLAIAIEAVTAEREEKKKIQREKMKQRSNKLIPGPESEEESDEEDMSSPTAPLSSRATAALFREQLDEATERLMNHLIDPKAAREQEREQTKSTRTSANPTLARAADPNRMIPSAASTSSTSTGSALDASFTAAFSQLQNLIEKQLPKRLLAQSQARSGSQPLVSSTTLIASQTTTTTTTTTTKTTFKLQQPGTSSALERTSLLQPTPPNDRAASTMYDPAAPAPPSQLSALINQLNERAGKEAPETHPSIGSASVRLAPAPPASKRSAATGRRGRAMAAQTARPSSSSSSKPLHPPPNNATFEAALAAAEEEDFFEATLDPSLPASTRAHLLEQRRQQRVAEVRNRLAAQSRSTSSPASSSPSLAALAALNQQQLLHMHLEEEDGDEDEEWEDELEAAYGGGFR